MTGEPELRAWLARAGIDTETWGAGGAKGVGDLWREIEAGESQLEDDPPRRVVEVVQVIIRRGDRVLLEIEQELADGRRRQRMRPPSEKLKRGEDYAQAARRCLVEELGAKPADVALVPSTHRLEQQTLDSPSYPGLPTRYAIHEIEARADALPDEDFIRDNAAGDDPCRWHRWGWRKA